MLFSSVGNAARSYSIIMFLGRKYGRVVQNLLSHAFAHYKLGNYISSAQKLIEARKIAFKKEERLSEFMVVKE